MTEHYYSENPQSESKPMSWKYCLRGRDYQFVSDVGVFSKREVDFGTRLLIETFEEPNVSGDFLDLGCGYGPIGIALADHFPNRIVYMVDINERAVKLAKQNAETNRVDNVRILQSDQFSNLKEQSFAAILTNPPIRAGKKVVFQMYEESHKALLPDGELWVVIQKKQGAPSTKNKLEELFDHVEVMAKKKGYFIFRAQKN